MDREETKEVMEKEMSIDSVVKQCLENNPNLSIEEVESGIMQRKDCFERLLRSDFNKSYPLGCELFKHADNRAEARNEFWEKRFESYLWQYLDMIMDIYDFKLHVQPVKDSYKKENK